MSRSCQQARGNEPPSFTRPALSSHGSPPFGLKDVYEGAVRELKTRKDNGDLSRSDFDLITRSTGILDLMSQVQDVIVDRQQHAKGRRVLAIGDSVLKKLQAFGSAIDMLVQSVPDVLDMGIVGLLWGTLRFFLLIGLDISNASTDALGLFQDVLQSLPTFELYVDLFGSSKVPLVREPLTALYAEVIHFALLAIRLYSQSTARTIWRATWLSLHDDFKQCTIRIGKASQTLERAAQFEHMSQTSEAVAEQRAEFQETSAFRKEARLFFGRVLSDNNRAHDTTTLQTVNDAPVYLLSGNFTGRERELAQIETFLGPTCSCSEVVPRCAIYGMSGVGKTQLALKYAADAFDRGQYSFVFWISASTNEKISQSFSKMLGLISHPDRYHPDQIMCMNMAKRWLETYNFPSRAGWLLVVDNVEESTAALIQQALPWWNPRGRILAITRGESIAKVIVNPSIRGHHVLEAKVPEIDESVDLFLKEAGEAPERLDNSVSQQVQALVRRLGRLPLAVSNTAAFMASSGKTPGDLLSLYSSRERIQLLSSSCSVAQKSVAAVYRDLFEQLKEDHPDANTLLRFLSFFDPEKIQVNRISEGYKGWLELTASQKSRKENSAELTVASPGILTRLRSIHIHRGRRYKPRDHETKHTPAPPVLESLSAILISPVLLQQSLQHLYDMGLITRFPGVRVVELQMHDLVRCMVRDFNMDQASRTALFNLALTVTCYIFRQVDDRRSPKSWPECEHIVPHIDALRQSTEPANRGNYPDLAWADMEEAGYLLSRGRYADAEGIYREELEGIRRAPQWSQAHHKEGVLQGLADTLQKQGRYNEAERLYLEALGPHTVLEKATLDQLRAAQGLVNIYDKQGRYADAVTLGEKTLKILETKLGECHPDTIQTMHNLGLSYGHTAEFEKAERLFRQALDVEESAEAFGPDHPETLRTVNALANLYDRKNEFSNAAECYKRAIQGREKLFGASHTQTIRSVCGLANVYMREGHLKDAEDLYTRVLNDCEKNLLVDTPDAMRAVHGVASVFISQGRFPESQRMYQRAIAGRVALLGEEHVDTLRSMEGLAFVYTRLGRYDAAEELYRKTLSGKAKTFGTGHAETATTVRNLALMAAARSRSVVRDKDATE
ncbi:hypothetical protein MFIFM68171_00098 [Madurella fahalii]|uniref:NB-ARC domain-containing protein n=1 Tax=Madurella fahalii TaxID=1157608 RepID=A0ABQ0FWL0_9PEZI